eukprot:TRINITY_DN19485_c0_g1_i1.p1 TRINITY_DN19485_c0_g1~~TRINITY_DN19485_c0_g1_i1.p1  ORF type:complete len:135 (+),score=8.72 TRINITY_DN19485_c0_g1_i1:68-472(+)
MKKPIEISNKPNNLLPSGGLGQRPVLKGPVPNKQGFRCSMDAPLFSSFSNTCTFEPNKVHLPRPVALPSLQPTLRSVETPHPSPQPGNRKRLDSLNSNAKLLPSVSGARSVVQFVSLPPLGRPFPYNKNEAAES